MVRCIAWAASPRAEEDSSGGGGASKPRQHTACDTYVIDLALADGSGGSSDGPQLRVADVRLLRHSVLPPHLVIVNPGQDAVLLGLDPDSCCFPPAAAEAGVTHIDCRQAGELELGQQD